MTPEQIADLIAANILTKLEDRQQILEEFDIQRRLERLCTILSREIELTGSGKAGAGARQETD